MHGNRLWRVISCVYTGLAYNCIRFVASLSYLTHSCDSCVYIRLLVDCRNIIHQLIEPNPELRIPLSEIQTHPWLTKNGKCPFVPYQAPPRNKNLRNQVSAALLATVVGCLFSKMCCRLSFCMFRKYYVFRFVSVRVCARLNL